jgi:hypothetical protein
MAADCWCLAPMDLSRSLAEGASPSCFCNL